MNNTTVGEHCFSILHSQIEGHWPKKFRVYHVIDIVNTAKWLADHKGMTLPQMRVAAMNESLATVNARLAADPKNESFKQDAIFIRKQFDLLHQSK